VFEVLEPGLLFFFGALFLVAAVMYAVGE